MNPYLSRRRRWLALMIIPVLAWAAPVRAQNTCSASGATTTCSIQPAARVVVQSQMELSVALANTNVDGGVTLNDPKISAYDSSAAAGIGASAESGWPLAFTSGTAPMVLTVKSNRAYQVQVASTQANWTISGTLSGNPHTTPKPSDHLALGFTETGTFTRFSGTTARSILTNSTGAKVNQDIFFRIYWDYATDVPGQYDLTLRYTITGN